MARQSEGLSWYRATATPSPAYLRLSGEVKADVCIVGAGYTGLSAALELAQAGYRTVVPLSDDAIADAVKFARGSLRDRPKSSSSSGKPMPRNAST